MNNGKLFILKAHGWQDIFIKNNSLNDKDSFDKTIADILLGEPGCNTILLPPISKAERYKIHRFQRKNKLLAETVYVNDNSELRNMIVTIPTNYLQEFLNIHAKQSIQIPVPDTVNNEKLDEKLDAILNEFKNKIKELINTQRVS
jgi:hypothetical protein